MHRLDRRGWGLAFLLAALAGYIDALGFIELGGFFVSFMSGNSTRMAVGIATHAADAVRAGGLIATFVGGVVIGTLARRRTPNPVQQRTSLALLALVLLIGAVTQEAGARLTALYMMAFAMGVENTAFERDGEVAVGLTYMTGALVKFGQKLAGAMMGGARWEWGPYLLLWGGLTGGAIIGALTHPVLGMDGLWLAAGWATGLALWSGLHTT
jgi:uncharacterized membrane protein YoaK (UPF0700 family)